MDAAVSATRVPARYADDFVVMCDTKAACERAEQRVREILARLGLELHPDKTRQVDLSWGREGFDFLGRHLHKRLSGRIGSSSASGGISPALALAAGDAAGAHSCEDAHPSRRVPPTAARHHRAAQPGAPRLGRVFPHGQCGDQVGQVDDYVARRLQRLLVQRQAATCDGGTPPSGRLTNSTPRVHRLRGTIQYPEAV